MPASVLAPPPRLPVVLARLRMPLMWAGTLALVLGGWAGLPWWARILLFLPGLAVYLRVGRVAAEPRTVAPPVRGRWMALGSPADGVPSQGTHAYGQTYALLLVAEPPADEGRERPDIGWRPLTRPPEDFPGFGAPVYAPADGRVVRVHDRSGDHRSRNSWPMLLGLIAETSLRELRGPAGLLGNHVVIELDGTGYALLAHLKRGSAVVSPGMAVRAGDPVARCGSSGALTEPLVHFQLMDHRWPLFAAGLPFRWDGAAVDGRLRDGVPESWRPFRV
ncbi:peptidase M23-like protein [Murinocardiopsis flavida]|uniref:Peptidase M23-like protein n=1 Tax=Murinocardiopsis flavida TaxID=645275 RepID=A0A2P8DUA8_9ACTN|nr:M23 family metallopeptidase [Murinocardiopsis flavida]PSL00806.1 peptidase M23-like protein [Murinocardiopsis flavida]